MSECVKNKALNGQVTISLKEFDEMRNAKKELEDFKKDIYQNASILLASRYAYHDLRIIEKGDSNIKQYVKTFMEKLSKEFDSTKELYAKITEQAFQIEELKTKIPWWRKSK